MVCGPDPSVVSIEFHFSDPAYSTLSALVSEIKLPIILPQRDKIMLLAQIDILKINTPKKKHFPFAIKFLKKVSHVLVSQKIIFEYIR